MVQSPIPSANSSSFTDTSAQFVKIIHLDSGSGVEPPTFEMICSLPPHRQTLSFSSYEEYEVHYNKSHVHRCHECRKNFPTEHFLNLHIEETHDALISVKRERGERTYSCFVEDCDRKCSTPQKRRMHLIDKHMFPKDYDFYIVNDGIDHRTSMLRSGRHRRRSSAAQHMQEIESRASRRNSTLGTANQRKHRFGEEEADEVQGADYEETKPAAKSHEDADVDDLTGAMSSLKFIPSSVRFGRGRGRGGFSRT